METLLIGQKVYYRNRSTESKELIYQVIQAPDLHHYLSELLGYDYIIVYKPRKSNTVDDALSRCDSMITSHFSY